MTKPPTIEQLPIDELMPFAGNPRKHSPEAIAKLVKSIEHFGWTNPILLDQEGRVLAGHARLKAAKQMGMKTVEVKRLPLSGDDAELYVIQDNKSAEHTEWDWPKLGDLLGKLDTGEMDLELSGFEVGEIEGLVQGLDNANPVIEDEAPEVPKVATSKTGDLWLLGEHRLLCGDSTKAEDVERLMGGEKAGLVSDPPYGISVNTSWLSALNVNRGKPACVNDDTLANDDGHLDLSWAYQYAEWLVFGFPHVARQEAYTGLLVWDKRGDGGEGGLGNPVEVAASNAFNGYRLIRHVWAGYIKEKGEVRENHPTQKPVGTMVDAIKLLKAQTLYDPFVGSGTTIIAAEQLGRKCYAMEIEPLYVDVAVKRWENFTGKTAKLA